MAGPFDQLCRFATTARFNHLGVVWADASADPGDRRGRTPLHSFVKRSSRLLPSGLTSALRHFIDHIRDRVHNVINVFLWDVQWR
jgi:hypothetical protein